MELNTENRQKNKIKIVYTKVITREIHICHLFINNQNTFMDGISIIGMLIFKGRIRY